jgi:hypothetical protein
MHMTPEFSLPLLTKWKKSQMLTYARQLLEAQHEMISVTGKSILYYTLQKKRRHKHMDHYPKGDRIDHDTGAQYFYHCHRENLDSMEHGHFHCFLRCDHIPQRLKPTPLPSEGDQGNSPMTHIVAISINRYGNPIRLFSVNRWVSSEIWYDAKHVPTFIRRFKMTLSDDPYWQVLDRWVEGMIHVFSPQIHWLQQKRDQKVADRRTQGNNYDVYEDTEIEELSEIPIDLNQQIQWLLG